MHNLKIDNDREASGGKSFVKYILPVSILVLVFLLPTLAHSLRIFFDSKGYPLYFFNVDNAWTMQYVHSLTKGLTYPPWNISSDLPGIKYQHGAAFLGYLLSRLPFISPYQAMLVVIPIAFYSLVALVLFRMAGSIERRGGLGFLLVLFILLFMRDGSFSPFHPVKGFIKITGVENYIFRLNQFMQVQAMGGYLLLLSLIYHVYFKRSFWISRASFALMIFFKAAYFPMALVILGVETLQEMYRRQRSLYVFDICLMAATAVVLKLVVQPNEYYDEFTRWMDFTHKGAWVRIQPFGIIDALGLLKYLILAVPLLILRPSFSESGLGESMRKMVFVVVINVVALTVFYVDTPNKGQFTDPIGLLLVCLNAMAFKGFMASANRIVTVIMAGHLVFFGLSNVIGGLKSGIQTALDPSKGHEYVYNRPLAEVLGTVDVAESHLIATNDLRYPANGFSRQNRQYQMSGLFGHTFFNSEMLYSFVYFNGDTAWRRREYLARKAVTVVLSDSARSLRAESEGLRAKGITHVVLHLNHPHIDYSGYSPMGRNDDYVMIRLSDTLPTPAYPPAEPSREAGDGAARRP